nr:hypothetical protein [Tanacetum cinerariifolium]
MEPRPGPARAVAPPLQAAFPKVRRRRERVVGFEETQNKGEIRVERNNEVGRPSEEEPRESRSQNVNLPPLLASHIGRSKNGQPLQSSLTSIYRGQALPNNVGGNLPLNGDPNNFLHLFEGAIRMQKWLMPIACHMFTYTLKDSTIIWWNSQKPCSILDYEDHKAKFRSHFSQQKKFTKIHLVVHNINKRENESTRTFITRYTDDSLQILGLYEDQRVFGFVYGLRTRSLVEHLFTDLPLTYKGLMEKTYTWVEAREVATNGVSIDQRDSFKRPKKSSWNNNKSQMGRSRSFPYIGESHKLLSNLAKISKEIFATERVAKTFEHPPMLPGPNWTKDKTRYCHFHEEYGHETNKCQELKHHIEEAIKTGQLAHMRKLMRSNIRTLLPKVKTVNQISSSGLQYSLRGLFGRRVVAVRRNIIRSHNWRRAHGMISKIVCAFSWIDYIKSFVFEESSETESKEQDTSSSSGNDAHDDDADIRPIYDEEPMDKENETLKKHYKEFFYSIKITRAKTIEHTTSLIATNDNFKAQLQKKGFAIAALKNELRKLKGNSVNTKFAKQSILGKPMLQSHRNHSVVRQPTAFKSERPIISKPRCDSQVDVNYDLLKPVTTHYLPKEREAASVGNKMHKAFPLLGESSHWQYKFPLLVEGVPTARRMEVPLPRVCTAMMKKLPVKENWQLH